MSFALRRAVQYLPRTSRLANVTKAFTTSAPLFTETVKFRFFEESNDLRVEVEAPIGKKVLDVALENNIDIEGACGGELACSTCHVIVPKDVYDKLPAKKIEEEDMLDLAWGVSDT
jgi:2Fe-2S ferredoxin